MGQRGRDTQGRTQEWGWIVKWRMFRGRAAGGTLERRGREGEGRGRAGSRRDSKQCSRIVVSTILCAGSCWAGMLNSMSGPVSELSCVQCIATCRVMMASLALHCEDCGSMTAWLLTFNGSKT